MKRHSQPGGRSFSEFNFSSSSTALAVKSRNCSLPAILNCMARGSSLFVPEAFLDGTIWKLKLFFIKKCFEWFSRHFSDILISTLSCLHVYIKNLPGGGGVK